MEQGVVPLEFELLLKFIAALFYLLVKLRFHLCILIVKNGFLVLATLHAVSQQGLDHFFRIANFHFNHRLLHALVRRLTSGLFSLSLRCLDTRALCSLFFGRWFAGTSFSMRGPRERLAKFLVHAHEWPAASFAARLTILLSLVARAFDTFTRAATRIVSNATGADNLLGFILIR